MVEEEVLSKFKQGIALVTLRTSEMTVLGIYLHKSDGESAPASMDIEGAIGEKVKLAVNGKAGKEKTAIELNLLDQCELGAVMALPFILPVIADSLATLSLAADGTRRLIDEGMSSQATAASVKMTFSADDYRAIAFCLEDPYLSASIAGEPETRRAASEAIRAAVGDRQGKEGIGFEVNLKDEKSIVYLPAISDACRVLIDIVNNVASQIQQIMEHTKIVIG